MTSCWKKARNLFRGGRRRPDPDAVGLNISLPGGASVTVTRPEQFPLVAALLKYLDCTF